MQGIRGFKQELRSHLSGTERSALLALIRCIDVCAHDWRNRSWEWRRDHEDTDAAQRALIDGAMARATRAVAPLLTEHFAADHNVWRTARAAEAFVAKPSEEGFLRFFEAATNSYPFGPGDGCLHVAELGDCRTLGAGCGSGIGFLDQVAHLAGEAEVLEALRSDGLIP